MAAAAPELTLGGLSEGLPHRELDILLEQEARRGQLPGSREELQLLGRAASGAGRQPAAGHVVEHVGQAVDVLAGFQPVYAATPVATAGRRTPAISLPSASSAETSAMRGSPSLSGHATASGSISGV
jgi:hypothetical protein